ncbi:response regulator transcription factor [Pseudomonas sp.]|uniref:response regulator transcription factor n=1 Tax=Pseudomonas sp. TaxID=306 RepID=UPI00272DB658|nr:response regulator transcription factor [Pseudomonas sp.]
MQATERSGVGALRLLLVEDHAALAANVFDYLGEQQYELDYAPDGLTALHLLATRQYDVVVLDVMLPGIDGFTLCRRIREDLKCMVPVLLLTARDGLEDKTQGFVAGADDYLVKPFAMMELELRINALQRRSTNRQPLLQVGPLRYDAQQERLWADDSPLELPPSAARILQVLMRHWPGLVSHEALAREVWGDAAPDANAVRTHVSALRRTLRDHGYPALIRASYGRGYRLVAPDGNEQ